MAKSEKKRVAVLMGGPSDEHDVSMMSGGQVFDALSTQDPVSIVIDREGKWSVDGAAQPTIGGALELVASQCDAVFVALHGPFGEDGTVQGLLEVFGLAYTGSGVLGSALAMDKWRSKVFYEAHDLPTPEYVGIAARNFETEGAKLLDEAEQRLGFPSVVKPVTLGSSFGVSFPENRGTLDRTVSSLVNQGHDVIVEKCIHGREVTCGILCNDAEGTVTPLPITEIIPGDGYAFFDYEAKYKPGATEEITPADLPPELAKEIQRLALEAHFALACRDMSRTDFMLDADLKPLTIETNTIPGFTKTSLLPQGAAAIGIDFSALVGILVANARGRLR